MSDLRDALKVMTELAAGDCPVSALAPYLRQAWSGAAAVSMVCALVASTDWAGSQWPGIPSDDWSTPRWRDTHGHRLARHALLSPRPRFHLSPKRGKRPKRHAPHSSGGTSMPAPADLR